jgi:putative tryptophan/tyrosine transport system substrate-binding protein
LAILASVGYPASVVEIGEVQAAARKLSYEVEILEVRRAEDIGPAFERLKSGVHALYVCGDALTTANSARINTLAMGARLPMIFPDRSFLEAGGFIAYGANNVDLFRRGRAKCPQACRNSDAPFVPESQSFLGNVVAGFLRSRAWMISVWGAVLAVCSSSGETVSGDDGRSYRAQICALVQKQ